MTCEAAEVAPVDELYPARVGAASLNVTLVRSMSLVRPTAFMKVATAWPSASVALRKSVPAARFRLRVKCWVMAPFVKSARRPCQPERRHHPTRSGLPEGSATPAPRDADALRQRVRHGAQHEAVGRSLRLGPVDVLEDQAPRPHLGGDFELVERERIRRGSRR